jgi:hypothetical protein
MVNTSSYIKTYPTNFKFSSLVCGTAGVDYNHFLAVSESGNTGLPIRMSFKVAVGDFSKISKNGVTSVFRLVCHSGFLHLKTEVIDFIKL